MSDNSEAAHVARRPMQLSLAVSVLMLAGKMTAYYLTGSAAILSDAAESVVHIVAVAFAAFSASLLVRPARPDSPYGYERVAFFSAGFEGGMIIVAALWIIVAAVQKWRAGLVLEELGMGTAITAAASVINLGLGWYLLNRGRKLGSLILEANGKHVLTDSWTSFGVVAGLVLVLVTGWKPFDPILAILVATNILWTGSSLIRTAVRGLMDLPDPAKASLLRSAIAKVCQEEGIRFHRLRFRDTGQRMIVSVHLLFAYAERLGDAHRRATVFEERLARQLPFQIEVFSHLEALEDHGELHPLEDPPE